MVVAGKLFRLSGQLSLSEIAVKLDGYRREESFEEGDYKFKLVSEVSGLSANESALSGVYSHDYVLYVFYRGKTVPLPRTVEALFSFKEVKDAVVLTVLERKRVANFIANKISELLFERVGGIVEARISPKTLREFHRRNAEDTKITFFDNVDIPNVDKLSLYGPNLINTPLFEDYLKRGDLWYVVARSKETGCVVGITRDASVTIFNLTDKGKYLDYVNREIYPLILEA